MHSNSQRKMRKTIQILLFVLFANIGSIMAQDDHPIEKPTIFDAFSDVSDTASAEVTIYQDKRIERLIINKTIGTPFSEKYATVQGFRVQVFSSNEQRNAKGQAYKIEELIKTKYPDLATYVTYQSPFWKVRVGDCETNVEAQELRSFLRTEFPEINQETYIVREQIRVPDPF